MKERPIIFSAAMVRALLDGSKTQTRRVVKGTALEWLEPGMFTPEYVAQPDSLLSPYGYAGDRLWVRESFWGCDAPGYGDQPCVVYDDEWHGKEYRSAEIRPWARKFGRIPSIHMPRDCSRVTLEVTGVWIERLHEIREADAIAEGIQPHYAGWRPYKTMFYEADGTTPANFFRDPIDSYRTLWESINGADSWDVNPWVWVIEFRIAPTQQGGCDA